MIKRSILPSFILGGAILVLCSLAGRVLAGTIKGNHPADLAKLSAAVRADRSMQLDLTVVLGLHDQAGLEQLLAEQQNSSSNNYHRWLTPAQFAQRFGPTQAQTEAVAQWLRSAGFRIKSVNRIGRTIDAAGSVAQAEATFQTSIVMSGASFGNTSDPGIPTRFDGLIAAIQGLDNMHAAVPAGLHRKLEPATTPALTGTILALADLSDPAADGGAMSSPGVIYGGSEAFGPQDVEKFYDESPLIGGGDSGTASPDCVALDEDSDYLDTAVSLFATSFNFSPFNISRVGSSPGTNGDETEALLDIDYAHATAPGTPDSRLHEQQPLHFDPEQHNRQHLRRDQYQLYLLQFHQLVLHRAGFALRAGGGSRSVGLHQFGRLGRRRTSVRFLDQRLRDRHHTQCERDGGQSSCYRRGRHDL
ncbi:MAG TPA: protease pro-enzyme activation domain-containing protein [Candidatus Binataceae bacterium]|jgi:hypothetical protein|nr:protease pro-enzyme activation domain-containing protein [Candidatus Binataceae bacterium]